MSTFKNCDFLVKERKHRTHDYRNIGSRVTQGAITEEDKAENPSVDIIHEGLSTRLTPCRFLLLQNLLFHHPWRSSRKKCIL